jgi:hypothetical protein
MALTTAAVGPQLSSVLPLEGDQAVNNVNVPVGPGFFVGPSSGVAGQVLPADTTITGLSASFNTSVAMSLPATVVTLQARIWVSSSASGGNEYFPVLAASVTLPQFGGLVPANSSFNDSVSGLNIVIPSGDLAVVVFSATASGFVMANTITGTGTVGISYNS